MTLARSPSFFARYRGALLVALVLLSALRLVACLGPGLPPAAATRTLPAVEVRPVRDPRCEGSAMADLPQVHEALSPTGLGGPPGALSAFHDALMRTAVGEEKTRIVHFGDSHSAADHLPGRVRMQLQARFGHAGPGMVMPGRPMAWYQHKLVQVGGSGPFEVLSASRPKTVRDAHVGLSGFALRSARGGSLTVASREDAGEAGHFSLVRAYFTRDGRGASLELASEAGEAQTFPTFGVPGELGSAALTLPAGAHAITLRGRGQGSLQLLGVVLERNVPGVILDTFGIVGARARELLKIDENLFREQLRDRQPDLIIFAYGTNEAMDRHQPIDRYKRDVREVIARAREAAPEAACLLVGPTDYPVKKGRGFQPRPRTQQLIVAQAELASELGCATFDLTALTGGPLSMLRMLELDPPFGARDRLHFTKAGYAALGDALTHALLQDYRSHRQNVCAR